MAKTSYTVDPNDKRLTAITDAEKKEINQYNKTYDSMIDRVQANTDKQVAAYENYGNKQTAIQEKQGQLAIDKLEMERQNAEKDYQKEQSAAYVDWQKQSNQYGANAEKQAEVGLAGSGYSESSQVAMYNQYQQRVALARETYVRADQNFAIAIKDAQLQNSAALAEIAFNTLKASLEAGLNGLMMENDLLSQKISTKQAVQSLYWDKYSTTLNQINTENSMAMEMEQFNKSHQLELDKLKLQKDQFAYQKAQDKKTQQQSKKYRQAAAAKKTGKSAGSSIGIATKAATKNTDAVAYLNALIKSGADKDKVANEIANALSKGEITKAEAADLRSIFTPRGVQY